MNLSTLFENAVFLEFRKNGFIENENIFYYSDQKIGEIDFVTFRGGKISCYQVAWNINDGKIYERELASLKKVREAFGIQELYLIVGDGITEQKIVDGIKIIPFFLLSFSRLGI